MADRHCALTIAFISLAGATGIQWRRALARPSPPIPS